MQACPKKGLSKPTRLLLPLVLLFAGCGDGMTTGPLGEDGTATFASYAQGPRGQMELAAARYGQVMSPENLAALRQAKLDYVVFRAEQAEREQKLYRFTRVLSKAAVDEGWSGGTTEWTFAWQGALALTDNGFTLISQSVPGHATILDVDVELTEVRHPWIPDLVIHVLSPAGANSQLVFGNPHAWDVEGLATNPNPTVDFLGTYFDDEALINVSAWDDGGLAPFTGSFQPYGTYNFSTGFHAPPNFPLSLADGQDMSGSWGLRVEDIAKFDEGTLNAWRLVITVQGDPLPAGGVGVPYSATPTGGGSDGTYAWSIASGTLPAGLTLNATTGQISGTPNTTGTSTFTIRGVQSGGGPTTATSSMSITINSALQPTPPASLPEGTVGIAYPPTQLSATGGGGGYAWSSANLPAGMTLSAGGVLGGVPSAAGTFSFNADVTSADGQTASMPLSVTVVYPPLAITTPSPVVAVAGVAFTQALQATGGGGGYIWSITSGVLPDGLSLSGGVISGTPQGEEVQAVTVTVTSTDGSTASKALTFQVTDPNDPVSIVTSSTLPGGVTSHAYSTSLVASGADHNYTWSLLGGALPGGLTLAPNGTLSGTPTLAGAYTFEAEVEAGYGAPVASTFTLEVVNPPVVIGTATLPTGVWGASYAATLQATGGTGTYAWSLTDGSLPPGIAASNDVLSGAPTQPGSFTFTVQATSGAGAYVRTDQKTFTVAVDYPPLVITTASLPSGGTGDVYTQTQLQATGGNNQYVWTITAGGLPTGLTLVDGLISGTPTAAGFYPLTVTATSGETGFIKTASRQLSISIVLQVPETAADCANGGYEAFRFDTEAQCVRFVEENMDSREGEFPTLTIVDTSVPDGQTQVAYGFTFTTTGGADNLDSYRTWAGDLPGWLALDSLTGTLSGTPQIAGSYAFEVAVTSHDDLQTASLGTTLSVAWTSVPSANVCAAGVWALYGFNTETQCRRFVDTGVDSREGDFPDPSVTTTSLPNGQPGAPYSTTLAAAGGADNPGSYYTWAVAGLPSWLTLDAATGILSGTPLADATYALSVTVTSNDAAAGYHVTSAPVSLTLLVATRLDPTTKDDCKKGGWETYGFRNQGQCIAFVNTGHDSR